MRASKGLRFEKLFTLVLVAASAVLFVVLNIIHMARLTPASGGMKAPDLVPTGYNHDSLTAWWSAMDEGARETFIGVHSLTLDLIFPFLLSWTLYRLLRIVLDGLPRFKRQRSWLKTVVPLALVLPYLVFDIAENSVVLQLLSSTEAPDMTTANMLRTLTVSKYSGIVLAFGCLTVFWLTGRKNRSA